MANETDVDIALLKRNYTELRKEIESLEGELKSNEEEVNQLKLKLSTGKGVLIGILFILGSGGVYLGTALKRLAG